jgi:MFS family permease
MRIANSLILKSPIDKFFKRNAFSISLSEFFWGIGIPVLMESTFLQIFLANEGASNLVVGMAAMVFNVSISVMPLFAAYVSSFFSHKRILVSVIHLFPSVSLIMLGAFYLIFNDRFGVVNIFFLFYILFSVTLGFTMPIWQNFIVKIFSPEKRVQGLSIMLITQNSAKLLSGLAIAWVLAYFGLMLNVSGMIILCTGIVFLLGSFGFLIAHEEKDDLSEEQNEHPIAFLIHYFKHVFKNKTMLIYILHDVEFFAVTAVFSFYARYATEFNGIDISSASGIFVTSAFAGAVIANAFFGFLLKGQIKSRLYVSKIISTSAVIILITNQSYGAFLIVSFLLGFSRGGRLLLFAPSVKLLSGLKDASPYFAIVPLFSIGFSSGMPLLGGWIIDHLHFLNGNAYLVVFFAFLILIAASFYPLYLLRFPEESDTTTELK